MPLFEVSFENIGYAAKRKDIDKELDATKAAKLFAKLKSTHEIPDGVVGLGGASLSEDDGQGKSEIKTFSSIRLQIQADSMDEAEDFDPPVALLNAIHDHFSPAMSVEEEWEVLYGNTDEIQADAVTTVAVTAKKKAPKPKMK